MNGELRFALRGYAGQAEDKWQRINLRVQSPVTSLLRLVT
jgi:hypothetical protein